MFGLAMYNIFFQTRVPDRLNTISVMSLEHLLHFYVLFIFIFIGLILLVDIYVGYDSGQSQRSNNTRFIADHNWGKIQKAPTHNRILVINSIILKRYSVIP